MGNELPGIGSGCPTLICVVDFSMSSSPEEAPGEMGERGDDGVACLRRTTVGITEKGWFSQGRIGARVGK
jgi:hypothetical protein